MSDAYALIEEVNLESFLQWEWYKKAHMWDVYALIEEAVNLHIKSLIISAMRMV